MTETAAAEVVAYSPSNGDRIERREPGSGRLVSTYPSGTADDVDRAAASASSALRAWSDLPAAERSALLMRAADLIAEDETRLAETLTREVGKPMAQSLAEVREGVALWRYAAASLRSLHGEFYPALANGTQAFTVFEPVGVVGLILPWNFPFIVSAERLPFILAAGCTVVVKPSEYAAGNAFELAEILERAGFPRGVYNVVAGFGHTAGAALVASPRVAMISFTGSTENGRGVMEAASRTLKRVSLELGGKSPVIVFADAAFDRAVEGVISGFTYNAGQCCIATSRLLLERSAADEFKTRLLARLHAMRDGAAVAQMQPAATEPQYRRVAEFLEIGRNEAMLLYGGETDGAARAMPTVFEGAPRTSKLTTDEIFGPVLSIYLFDTEEEAIELANDTPYGLAACVWSGDVSRAMRVVRRIHAGRLWINSPQENFPEMPVGGMGASGIGREAGSAGIRSYCEIKSVIMKSV
jgi:acyl-CoA reductase-like NAD-dependent aldehyde dehydrogenase